MGIVMEPYGLEATGASALLTRLSSHSNRKVVDVAVEIVMTKPILNVRAVDHIGSAPRSAVTR